jgi:DNA-binding NarL/FixJ family response regulator
MKAKIKVGLAEDHGALRQGYVSLLKAHKNIDVLFDVEDGKELLDKLKVIRPHILLLDLEMPKMRGQEVLEVIKAKYPTLRVIIVSAYFQKDYILECFKLGVKSFLRKEYKIERIVEAIIETFNSGGYIDNEVALILANEISNSATKSKPNLTEQQITVLKLICGGHKNKEVAEILGLSVSAIKFHRANIMDRTKSANLQDLVTFAILNKYIEPK